MYDETHHLIFCGMCNFNRNYAIFFLRKIRVSCVRKIYSHNSASVMLLRFDQLFPKYFYRQDIKVPGLRSNDLLHRMKIISTFMCTSNFIFIGEMNNEYVLINIFLDLDLFCNDIKNLLLNSI